MGRSIYLYRFISLSRCFVFVVGSLSLCFFSGGGPFVDSCRLSFCSSFLLVLLFALFVCCFVFVCLFIAHLLVVSCCWLCLAGCLLSFVEWRLLRVIRWLLLVACCLVMVLC